MRTKIAINGFGRIGRQALKIILERENLEVVAINDLAPIEPMVHLLKYDSVYGKYNNEVSSEVVDENHKYLLVNNAKIQYISQPDPKLLPWGEMGIDVVLECTGRFEKDGAAKVHLGAGAKKVIVSAPTKGGDIQTFIKGVNEGNYSDEDIISNASCTTNNAGPIAEIMNRHFGIKKAALTTFHSYTASQNLVDGFTGATAGDLRRIRAAGNNLVPSTTGAAISTTEIIKELKGKFDGLSVRVPTICGSLTDFTFLLEKPTTQDELKKVFTDEAASTRYKGILQVTSDPLVSSDIIGNTHSAIVDLELIKVIDGDLVKVMAWYDNEAGYSTRLIDMIDVVCKN